MKIPKEAKRVFKGKIFQVYQWQQKMFDGSVETFEMLKRPDTVQVIATQGGNKLLICYEEQPVKPPSYGFFGGRVYENEEPLAAAKRELLEEGGLVSEDWELWQVYEPVAKIEWKIYTFIARNCQKVAESKLDSGERIKVEAVDFEEFLEIAESPEFRSTQFSGEILRLRMENKLEGLRKKLFGQLPSL